MWRGCCRDWREAQVRLRPVHSDRLRTASDLDEEVLEAWANDLKWALVSWCQRRLTSALLYIHQLGRLQLTTWRPSRYLSIHARLIRGMRPTCPGTQMGQPPRRPPAHPAAVKAGQKPENPLASLEASRGQGLSWRWTRSTKPQA